ncbi:gamma-glutamyltransferase [Solirubrobacter taibaiensis]|nr:gamma-glutamyltransferase [Solirubrobacter taibaiensis]
MQFTTRPELSGTFGMVASTHWLASAAGMAVLERGGNAFDAAVAAGFALQVVEPHMNGPGGDLPLLLWDGSRVRVICGQGPAPAAATIDAYRGLGLDLVPGVGPYAACVPGAFDAWCTLLRDFGSWELADVLAYAIGYARDGFPATPGIVSAIARIEPEWEASARIWRPVDGRLRNPMLADTYERLAAVPGPSREARIDAARDAWYRGWVAEALAAGFLTPDDLAPYAATIEEPVSLRHGHWTVFKTGPWGQGPVFLQQLALLPDDLGPFLGIDHVHTVVEGAKLAFADRDAWYGDSAPVPLDLLLSGEYAEARRALIDPHASAELRPGGPSPRYPSVREGLVGDAEPTRGDTCHLDVADRFGNLVSATPSGGWLQSSPAIDGLGFALGTRAQMFWLEAGFASSLKPGVRPRTTLSPSMAVHDDGTVLAFGTPGGDQQDQWAFEFFLAHTVFGLNLQEAIDAPMFHTDHFPSSFHPREVALKALTVEGRVPEATLRALRERGHAVEVAPDWSQGRLSAISRAPDGLLRAGANPRGMQGYAVGR